MKIATSHAENEVVLIEVDGEIDAHTARELDKSLNDLLAQIIFADTSVITMPFAALLSAAACRLICSSALTRDVISIPLINIIVG